MPRTPQAPTAASFAGTMPQKTALRSDSLAQRIAAYLRGRAQPQTRLLKQIETLQLGPKRTVYLVECDGDRFLIAAAGDSVSAPVPLTQSFAMRDAARGKEKPR